MRNGYVQPIQIDMEKCLIKGVFPFFKNMELNGGELLLFEYFGRYNFHIYIIGSNGSEIRYPVEATLPGIGDQTVLFFLVCYSVLKNLNS